MYIQEMAAEKERTAPPDYSGHTYAASPMPPAPPLEEGTVGESEVATEQGREVACDEKKESASAGAFFGEGNTRFSPKSGKRGDFFGNLGLGGLFSRVPLLSSLLPPPRRCEGEGRKHSELWDFVLLAVVALSLLNGRDDDVLPILLLLLLWD